jgi:pyridinium-3,5-biscarboxylic acid mononucleotide sulfurtransferase
MNLADLDGSLRKKYQRLDDLLRQTGSLMVAYSGGVDSGLLAAAAHQALGQNMLAVTIRSKVETPDGVDAACQAAKVLGFPHQVVDYDDLASHQFVANPPDRCYHCKLLRLGELKKMAKEMGYAAIAEGSNAEDGGDYRPGKRAVLELEVISPLAEAGLTKKDVRALAKALGLPSWDRPSAPCLATRFPYGTPVSLEGIEQIAKGEAFLNGRGYETVRVRHYGSLARLEVAPEAITRLASEREVVAEYFKSIGFTHVAVDLLGYRSGSLNEGLVQK